MTVIDQLKSLIRQLRADGVTLDEMSRATDGKVSPQHIGMWLRGASLSLERFSLLCEATGQILGRPASGAAPVTTEEETEE